MRIAYCEDEPIQIEYMHSLVRQWAEENQKECSFSGYGSSEEMLFENEGAFPFDMMILDIEMKDMDGMQLARRIRERDKDVVIIFLTNKKEYVFEGYEVNAFRYLLKPIEREKLFGILDEADRSLNGDKRFMIETVGREAVKIELDHILCIEANGHYVRVHTVGADYEFKKNLMQIQKEISDAGFLLVHRSYLVNLRHIERIAKKEGKAECLLSDNTSVPVSRSAYKEVNQAFINYGKAWLLK